MQFQEAIIKVDGNIYQLTPGRANTFEEIYVDFQQNEETGGRRYTAFLHPKKDVVVNRLELRFRLSLPDTARFLANGYQSWSESGMLPVSGSIPRLRRVARRYMGYYGDEWIPDIPHGKGKLHSWTYTTILKDSLLDHGWLAGSLSERTGFTLFLYDHASGILTVRKDMDNMVLTHSFPAMDVWLGEGAVSALYDSWFKVAQWTLPSAPPIIGWTSWYRYFNKISEQVIADNLEAFAGWKNEAELKESAVFQIDDGWQAKVGDWLKAGSGFPEGMGTLAGEIKAKGLQPGLWLAPFVAEADSELARRNPEWLLKDKSGKPLRVGWNPYWGGWYFALDFYQEGVREYLSGVFHRVLDQWGFELLKLDFLFAAALAPPPGKTRGGVMWEVMEFLRHQLGDRKMLACGVPLGAAFGLADYCRIGGDVHTAWKHTLLRVLRHRERVDTLSSLRSTLVRWPLNGRAFINDPDVFMLRQEQQHLKPEQQQTLLTANALLGGVLFTSDDVGGYSEMQQAELGDALWLRGSKVKTAKELEPDYWRIDFEKDAQRWQAHCNLGDRSVEIKPPAGEKLQMGSWESLVLKC
ncbi:MAG: alpha-galactosidase [Saprospiraceae bacterium]|nr:alpha-galactosidase [Saprospiraceae bacterium]